MVANEIANIQLTPPLILKNTQALTAKLKPKASEMYSNVLAFGICERPPDGCDCVPAVTADAALLATWVAAKAKNRNIKVPRNSPTMAMK